MNTERETHQLEEAMSLTDSPQLYERYLAVKLVLQGSTKKKWAI